MSKRIVRGLVVTVALCALLAAANCAVAFVTSGNIYEVQDEFGNDIGSTVDHWYFTVHSPGIVTIDTLSWEVDTDDFDFDGDFDETFDVNGDGEIAFIDVNIYLFSDDGSLDVGDLLFSNDDDFADTYGDGSIYGYDSYLSVVLNPGNYILALGAFFLDSNEAVAGLNDEPFYPTSADGFGNYTNIDHGDYQITWTGDLTITRGPIPEPGSAILAAIAVAGLSAAGRRRRSFS
jgi:uncharacterized protein (TIGR03382 family)